MTYQEAQIIRAFHELYYYKGIYERGTITNTYWMGVGTEKCPLDLWIYQEILHEVKPQLIIETGTKHGGSALFLCHMCDLLGIGEVVTIDIASPTKPPEHSRLTYIRGSSTAPDIVQSVYDRAEGKSPVMVILDSDHSMSHVLGEMRAYHRLVTPGSYMIVEDTNVNGHPVMPQHGPGPLEAVQAFFRENQDFEVDYSREKFLMTCNPCGYLRKRT
ncbi:MAG: cephalosporin hydroxylase family protein [Gemmataceae bacterium]|nr:cephalosporin hydroxylase family protein [Gemmataceae bacterium]MDW8266160.1 CmcI family methyltransferase [Gemmataceae bacterium]